MKSKKRSSRPKKKGKPQRESVPWQSMAAPFALFLLAVLWISSFLPEKRLWGINHWAYFPLWLRSVAIAVGLLIFIPRVNQTVRSVLEGSIVQVFGFLLERRKFLGYALSVAGSVVVFHLLRTRVHLLGDGFQILENINAGALSVNWSQPLAIWIYLSSFKLLHQLFQSDGSAVYASISYFSGAIYVVFALKMGLLLGKSSSVRLFVFLLLMLMGSTQLFFGYAEHYPLLVCGILVYLFYSLKVLCGGAKLLTPVIIFCVLLPLHFSSLCLLPSTLFLLFSGEGGKQLSRMLKGKKTPLILFFLSVMVAALALYIREYRWFAFSYFVPLLHGGYTGPGYTLFSVPHILDFINQQVLISPAGLALFVTFLISRLRRSNAKDPIFRFLLIVSAAQLLFNFLINPGLGAARDWDLFAAVGLGYTVLALYLFSREAARSNLGHLKLHLTTVALLCVLPWILINSDPDKSVARFRNLLELDPKKSRNGHFILAGHFDRTGKPEEVDRENRSIKEKFPEVELTNQGYSLLAAGDLESAHQRFVQAIRISPDFAEAHAGLGWYHYKAGSLEKCEEELIKAVRLKPDYQRPYMNLGEIYLKRGDLKKAECFYARSVKLGMDDPMVFNNLGIIYAQFGDLDKAISFYEKAIAQEKDFAEPRYGLAHLYYQQGRLEESLKQINVLLRLAPGFALGYYQLGLTYEGLGRKQEAASAYQRYLEMEPQDPRAAYLKQTIQRLKRD